MKCIFIVYKTSFFVFQVFWCIYYHADLSFKTTIKQGTKQSDKCLIT